MDGTIARRPRYHQNNHISDWLEIYRMNRLAGGLNLSEKEALMMGNECIHASKEMLLAVCKDIT